MWRASLFACLTSVSLWSTACDAKQLLGPAAGGLKDLELAVDAGGSQKELDPQVLYKVAISCEITSGPSVSDRLARLFVKKSTAATHYVIFSGDSAKPDTSGEAGKITMPASPIRMAHLYSYNGDNLYAGPQGCPQPFFVSGNNPTYFTPFAAYSTKNNPGIILDIGYRIASLIPILSTVFAPAAISDDTKTRITAYPTTESPVKQLLANLDKNKSYGETFRLKTGVFRITSKYSKATITVSKLPSIVGDKDYSLLQQFKTSLASAPDKIPTDKVETTCGQIASALKDTGFGEDKDIPYALSYLSSLSVVTKPKMLECLGDDYAEAAIKLGPKIWNKFRRSQQLSDVDLDKAPPNFSKIGLNLNTLINIMSAISKGEQPVDPATYAKLKSYTTEKIWFDQGAADFFGNIPSSTDIATMLDLMIKAKYFRYGCFVPPGANNGLDIDPGYAATMLAFNVSPAAADAEPKDSVVLHLFYKRRLITGIRAFKDLAWSDDILTTKHWFCGELTVRKPADH